MKKLTLWPHRLRVLGLALAIAAGAGAQTLTLDSCRALALQNDKRLQIGLQRMDKSRNERRAAHTNYLPKISLTAGYMRSGDQIALLSDKQQAALGALGTNLSPALQQTAAGILQQYPQLAPLVQSLGAQAVPALDKAGSELVDALRTDTRNLYAGALILTQPLYMGGKIRAYNRMARMAERVAGLQQDATRQEVLLNVDQAYWQVVALAHKKRLAEAYLEMLRRFDADVQKLCAQGLATRSDALGTAVKVNEAEMTLTQVSDGLQLARMLLAQRCGLPIADSRLRTADEEQRQLSAAAPADTGAVATALAQRSEIKQLQAAISVYDEKIKAQRADYLPHLALTGGYMVSNPNVFNSFENKFRGTWGVGVTLSVPVLTWNEHKYKINAAKADAQMARLELADAQEKIELQVNQAQFNRQEADKRLRLALKSEEKAQEHLRMARAAYKEGAETTTNVLAAHTAWLQAENQIIDAQIDTRLADVALRNVMGVLGKE